MYVACRKLKTSQGTREIGEVLPEVDEWRHTIVLAHVNMGWIKWVEGSETVPSKKNVTPKAVKKAKKKKQPEVKVEAPPAENPAASA